jgi:FlaA1/EpsC-like NDP-sugar epimerase
MRVLITGITGTMGKTMAKKLIKAGVDVSGISRCELKQSELAKEIPNADLFIGDIRDYDSLKRSARNCNVILHAAALKRVDSMEMNPHESIKTNIQGTENVCKVQNDLDINKIVFVSTDKAVYPVNVYGQCKAISEAIVRKNRDSNIIVRYGNVLNSRGSIIPLIKKTMTEQNKVLITHPDMSRFWIKIETVAEFLMSMVLVRNKGGLYLPEMKACPVIRLFKATAKALGLNYDKLGIDLIGIRPGEKLHECVKRYDEKVVNFFRYTGDTYSNKVKMYELDELHEIIKEVLDDSNSGIEGKHGAAV